MVEGADKLKQAFLEIIVGFGVVALNYTNIAAQIMATATLGAITTAIATIIITSSELELTYRY